MSHHASWLRLSPVPPAGTLSTGVATRPDTAPFLLGHQPGFVALAKGAVEVVLVGINA